MMTKKWPLHPGLLYSLLCIIFAAAGVWCNCHYFEAKSDFGLARYPISVGLCVLFGAMAFYAFFTGHGTLRPLYCGADGRPSTSKFQAMVWTIVALFTYAGIYTLRWYMGGTGGSNEDSTVPKNLLIAMGFSFTTLAAAKAITVSYLNSGQISKDGGPADTNLMQSDDGSVDLSKAQMLWWTFLGVGIYLFTVFDIFRKPASTNIVMPDIGTTLMVLMGLSHGVYVGKKLVTVDTPTVNPLSVNAGPPGTVVTLTGSGFGASQAPGSQILLDGSPVAATSWSDGQIVFTIPATHPSARPWTSGQRVAVDVAINGTSSIAPATFTVVLPVINAVLPNLGKPTTPVTINGAGFGSTQVANRSVTVGGVNAAITGWSDRQIVVTVPSNPAWPAGQTINAPIVVHVDQQIAQFPGFSVQT
jgi:hypothetical protein